MKHRFFTGILCLLWILTLSIGVSASQSLPMVVDHADLLSQKEMERLESRANILAEEYHTHVVIVTIDGLNGESAQDYADDYFDQNGYGYGGGRSGILFLLAMQEREWYISTCGETIYAVTDYGIQQLGNAALDGGLSSGDYYRAFCSYLDMLESYLSAAKAGEPMDGYADYSGDYYHGTREDVVYSQKKGINWLLSVFFGLAAAGITVLVMIASMNTRRRQYGAASYIQKGSFRLNIMQDLFLYSSISKTRRPENTGSRGHSGGGSSVHHSSSGRSHGGGGGKF